MNNKNPIIGILFTIIGFIVLALGVLLLITNTNPQGIIQALPFTLLGVGVGAFFGGLSGVLGNRILKNNPDLAKQKEIEVNDERNNAIANKAKARTFDLTWPIFVALIIFITLMQVEAIVILVFVGVFVLMVFLFLFFLIKYNKEM